MSEKTLKLIAENDVKWVDLRFTDNKGKEHHISYPVSEVQQDFFDEGKMFDGSSISGWKSISESDMILKPDDASVIMDPFSDEPTAILRCDIMEPTTLQGYDRDPRSIAKRAETYLKASGIGDTAFFGPEPEFFVFDSVKWEHSMGRCSYEIHSEEAAWSSGESFESGNLGHRPRVKGGYFPVPPVDSLHDLRTAMCNAIQAMGLEVEVHHHEVGTAGQCEIGVRFNTLVRKADEVQILKYCIQNVAHSYGKTATFMPKPLVGDNGSGMHIHMSLAKKGKNLFAGENYGGLSDLGLYSIGGIIKHAHAINAFANPSTNSYKRLVPGFEAPVMLAYSARNRSAAIRIPYVQSPNARRIEVRFPDPAANPYLVFSAMLLAAIDGIKQKLHPGDAADKDLYDLPPEEALGIKSVATSLDHALDGLDEDREFLLQDGVFSNDMIDSYIAMKREECTLINQSTHPAEFDLYYSV